MQGRAISFEKVALASVTMELSPWATVRVTIGADIVEPYPAPIVAGRIGAEMERGIHVAATTTWGGVPRRWRWREGDHDGLRSLLTGGTKRFVDETCKRFGLSGALTGWRSRLGYQGAHDGSLGWPYYMQNEAQPQVTHQQQLVEKRI